MDTRNSQNDGQILPAEMQALFASYREALPDCEADATFMPGLWAKIDAKRSVTYSFRRLVGAFVTASAALCILLTAGMYTISAVAPSTPGTVSYIEVLDDHELDVEEFDLALVRSESR